MQKKPKCTFFPVGGSIKKALIGLAFMSKLVLTLNVGVSPVEAIPRL
jgi:hypothetical protein